ncbi:hypothetical protein ACRQ1B_18255 [Rhizobium panacihumi]|uniref:hypothetical protein n=1 Tax=Rhizobium panacihumi TaxID=2008450 RepID=UPI003D79E01C
MPEAELTCEVRYHIDKNSLEEFAAYARTWIALIERHGGLHHGYLVSRQAPAGATISFPGQGDEEAELIAIARFTFPNDESYLRYRDGVQSDPDGIAANSRYGLNPPFKRYMRTFLQKLA